MGVGIDMIGGFRETESLLCYSYDGRAYSDGVGMHYVHTESLEEEACEAEQNALTSGWGNWHHSCLVMPSRAGSC